MSKVADIVGIIGSFLKIGLGATSLRLKNSSGVLAVRNSGDTADAAITASTISTSNTSIIINSAATYPTTLATGATPTAAVNFAFPNSNGTSGYVLQTDGSGNTSWVTQSGGTNVSHTVATSFTYSSGATVNASATLPANAVLEAVRVFVDTAANTSATISVGVSGTAAKYVATTQVDLTTAAIYEIYPGLTADTSAETIIATFVWASATAGAGRFEFDYH